MARDRDRAPERDVLALPVAPDPAGGEPSATDAALVREAQRGNAEAFELLVRRHLRAAYAVAAAVLGDAGGAVDAEDVCQEAFLTGLQRIRECREPERFRSWLLAIVRNHAHNQRARAAVRAASPLDGDGVVVSGDADRGWRGAGSNGDATAVASGEDPLRDAERAELRGNLQAALDTLTELQRNVVILHDHEGWRHAEIARELGISPGASRFHLHVARRALRRQLSKLYARESIA